MPVASKQNIRQYLVRRDPKLREVFCVVDFPAAKRNKDIYATLLRSIISQQLSIKAADTIHDRFLKLFPAGYPEAERLKRLSLEKLRSAGVSRQKAGYLKAIAKFSLEQGMEYNELAIKNDQEVIEYLTEIHGVGRWTVEMLLMFSLNRKDVFPVDDVGIQNAMRHLYQLNEHGRAFKQKLCVLAEHWQPYRTIVCKCLWRWKSTGYATAE